MIFKRRKHPDLDKRVDQAAAEAERSRQRLHEVREEIIAPLVEAAQRNQFADVIRYSLIEGHTGRGHRA